MPEGAATAVALKDVGRGPIIPERSDSFGVGASTLRTRTWWSRTLDRHGSQECTVCANEFDFRTRGNQAKPA